MYQFFGQRRFTKTSDGFASTGYELFLRERTLTGWRVPADFSVITYKEFAKSLWATLSRMPKCVQQISFNLEPRQFIDEDFLQSIVSVAREFNFNMSVELVERRTADVSLDMLVKYAQRYQANGLSVCIDDVGTGTNTLELVNRLNPYVDEYKYAIQNVRDTKPFVQIIYESRVWQYRARQAGKKFTLEGIENAFELKEAADRYHCDYFQGFYLSQPEKLPASFMGLFAVIKTPCVGVLSMW